MAHETVSEQDKTIINDTYAQVNLAAVQRQIQALTAELVTLTTSKAAARTKPKIPTLTKRASVHASTKRGYAAGWPGA